MATPAIDMVAWRKETEAAPLRRYSSSSTLCFDDLFRHELYKCVGMVMNDVCAVNMLSLSDLPVSSSGGSSVMNVRNGAALKDKHAGEYVRSLIPSNATDDLSVSVDQELELFHELRPLLKSVENRPDVVVLTNKLPLLIVEVQSSSYSKSLCKTVVGLIDQLRLLRNYNTQIQECTGFTFPDFHQKVCVTKVEIEWKNFCFNATYTPLTSSSTVRREVSVAITNSLQFSNSIIHCLHHHALFFVPFSRADLLGVSDIVEDHIICQVHSRQSIVLEGEKYFWKYSPDIREREQLTHLFSSKYKLFPDASIHSVRKLKFFGVPKLIPPLSRQDAKSCLYSLVEKVAGVLQNLHEDTMWRI